ncbi:hypothetical protein K435DRAFT_787397 [Dendrothele bispora CBS 962.96]|uniref:Uncharacterized protein n=1 Tax=Dendrothele bispora (strain CBS 962.96) TaxID=1314807 RepID=A0A4S8KLH0_DENBC|nr:hypothetical protein K435DRAFT_787397 [Dendrothele bispora CBS 962.96]
MRFSLAPIAVLALVTFTQAAPIMSRRNLTGDYTHEAVRRHYSREYDHEAYNRRSEPLEKVATPRSAVYKRVHARDFGRGSRL